MSRTESDLNYNAKIDIKTRKKNQDFGRQNNSMSRTTLDSAPLGTNTTNRTTSSIESIPVRTKTPEPTPLKLPEELPEQNGKAHVPGDPDPDPSSSDSSSKESNLSKDSNSSELI